MEILINMGGKGITKIPLHQQDNNFFPYHLKAMLCIQNFRGEFYKVLKIKCLATLPTLVDFSMYICIVYTSAGNPALKLRIPDNS